MLYQNKDGNPNDQQQGSRGLEDRNNPAIQLAESLKGIKDIENAKKGDKSVPEQMAPDKANSTILMLGAMALLIAGAMALPAGAVAIPFLGIMAGVAGAMGVKNMADMAGITPGKGNKREIDNKLDNAKLEAINNAIAELKKNNYKGSSQSQDPRLLVTDPSSSQKLSENEPNKDILLALDGLVKKIGKISDQQQLSQSSRQGAPSNPEIGWVGGGGADEVSLKGGGPLRRAPVAFADRKHGGREYGQ